MLGPQHVNFGGENVQFTGDPSSLWAQYRVPECCVPSLEASSVGLPASLLRCSVMSDSLLPCGL